jgi:hypothetical protein
VTIEARSPVREAAQRPAVLRSGESLPAPGGRLQLTQAAREGAMEAWLEILSQRHPELLWVPKERLDLEGERS